MFFNIKLECKLSIKRKQSQQSGTTRKKSRLFSFELALSSQSSNMAIAFFVPPEYGPAPVQQAQQQEQNPPVRVLQHAQDVNNNVNTLQVQHENPSRGLISMFVEEIMAVISRNNFHHRPAPQSHPPNQQDNQGRGEEPEGVLSYLPFRSLPDIVTCHAGMSVRCGSGRPAEPLTVRLPEASVTSDVVPLSPRSELSPSCDFEVSLKLDLTMATNSDPTPQLRDDPAQSREQSYRIAGAHLRHIADNYTLQRSRHANQSTFELQVVISVALPAVAILGLGIAYLRRC